MMYEILVPCGFALSHHHKWDDFVRSQAGGLTLLRSVKGQWVNNGELYAEWVIPVRIACDRETIERIIDFTIAHYGQKAVMAYKISDEVIIKYAVGH